MQNMVIENKNGIDCGGDLDNYLSVEGVPDICKMTREQFDTEIMKGYQDVLEQRVMPVEQTFAEIRKNITGMRCAQPVEK